MLDPAIGYIIVLSVAALLSLAAIHKLIAWREFIESLQAYRLLPQTAVRSASLMLPLGELATAFALFVSTVRPYACGAAAAIMLVYASAIALNLARGRHDLDCGCGFARHRRPIAAWMLLRNGAIAIAALTAGLPWSARPLGPIDVLTIVAAAAAAALFYASIDVLFGQVAPYAAMARAR
jgi:hypothetical protein